MTGTDLKRLLFILFITSTSIVTAQKAITIDDFTTRNTFRVESVSGINWTKDGKYYTAQEGNSIRRFNIATGEAVETIVDNVLPAGVTLNGYSFSSDEKKVLLATNRTPIYRHSFVADYYVYDLENKKANRLSQGAKQSYATFSPDGSKVAFVRENNLFFVNLSDMSEEQVTSDGKFNHIINGTTDWVYEEELSFVVGFFWSPDSRRLAYYRFDESAVKEYNLQVWGNKLYPIDYRFKYPKAGEENSKVEIRIYDLQTKSTVPAQARPSGDGYIPRVKWTNNPEVLAVRVLNRLQNELQLFHVNASDGSAGLVLDEKSPTYIDLRFVEDLVYLKNGKSFIYESESNGFKHLYLYDIQSRQSSQITKGEFEVSDFIGVDEKTKYVYFTSTEVSPLERHLYRVSIDGKKKERLTTAKGQHQINMSPDFAYYIDFHKSADVPTVASLYQTRGNKLIKVLKDNSELRKTLKEYGVANKEFFTFNAADGTPLTGYYLKPLNFVAGKKYPILLYQYSGPGSQNAGDTWAGSHFFFHQMLVQKDYIVAVVDTRGTGSRGEKFKKMTYKQLGKYELEDLLEAGKFFAQQPFIDGERMGIWGWSYGGYMSALAMTKGAGIFKAGIAVAPVTNWRFYDTIYTERFLQTPQLNPSGYDDNSPLSYADKLQGNFLLVHGTGDDNVHFQNSVMFESALIEAGKQFRSFYYPDKHHGIAGGKTRHHLYTMMLDFLIEKL